MINFWKGKFVQKATKNNNVATLLSDGRPTEQEVKEASSPVSNEIESWRLEALKFKFLPLVVVVILEKCRFVSR